MSPGGWANQLSPSRAYESSKRAPIGSQALGSRAPLQHPTDRSLDHIARASLLFLGGFRSFARCQWRFEFSLGLYGTGKLRDHLGKTERGA